MARSWNPGALLMENKNRMTIPQKIKNRIIMWFSNSTSGIYPKEWEARTRTYICIFTFMASLFTIATGGNAGVRQGMTTVLLVIFFFQFKLFLIEKLKFKLYKKKTKSKNFLFLYLPFPDIYSQIWKVTNSEGKTNILIYIISWSYSVFFYNSQIENTLKTERFSIIHLAAKSKWIWAPQNLT